MASDFTSTLDHYKTLVDTDIKKYANHITETTRDQYGEYATVIIDAFANMLMRGGKRIRGALVMVGYEMMGGNNQQMIVRAATALEMLHAYLLIVDDIQDRSLLRRKEPTLHTMLGAWQRERGWRGDTAHGGMVFALNAALAGAHAAHIVLASLDAEAERKIKVIGIVNHADIVTTHGQTNDIANEMAPVTTIEQVMRTLEWKAAHYTFLNPLCVGMVLAGAECEDTDAIRDYALSAGRAFQITDDILGVYGTEAELGKSPLDDIREGKRTLLTVHALTHASKEHRDFLLKTLGNTKLTKADFKKCQHIIKQTGSLDYARGVARQNIEAALASLDKEGKRWKVGKVIFLRQIAEYLATRTA